MAQKPEKWAKIGSLQTTVEPVYSSLKESAKNPNVFQAKKVPENTMFRNLSHPPENRFFCIF
jgi:hypothetical protein